MYPFARVARLAASAFLSATLLAGATAARAQFEYLENEPRADGTERMPTIVFIDDPLEPLNRTFGAVNHGLMKGIVLPATAAWRFALPVPVRSSIRRVGDNLRYPIRLVNNLAQGKGRGAWVETKRFGINTTIGVLGIWDPARKRWNLQPSVEDCGQTLGKWGAGPGFSLMLPLLGPSNGRDTVGRIGDFAFDPLTYAGAYGAGMFFSFNDMSFTLRGYERFIEGNFDPYLLSRDLWAVSREKEVLDFKSDVVVPGRDTNTLKVVFLGPEDPEFTWRAHERSVVIPSTGRKLPYMLWLQPGTAPLVYVIPGAGGHRWSDSAVAVAEMLHKAGYSAVAISSPLHAEFIQRAATTEMAGYAPEDARDVRAAIDAIHASLVRRHGSRIGPAGLIGLSMGGLNSLFIAAAQKQDERTGGAIEGPRFERIVAVNPPVDMLHAIQTLDAYYDTPLKWPVADRNARMSRVFLRAANLAGDDLTPSVPLPFSDEEAHFLIGLSFRLTLRDMIYLARMKANPEGFLAVMRPMRRTRAFREIEAYSFRDYVDLYLRDRARGPSEESGRAGTEAMTRESMLANASLASIADALAADSRIRVATNDDDFLLREGDVGWLEETFGGRLTVFPEGGHLGNLHEPGVQAGIMAMFEGLGVARETER